jgi:hypothetical protein
MAKKLVQLAAQARKAARSYSHNHITKDLFWHRDPDLAGLCAITSAALLHLLKRHRPKSQWRLAHGRVKTSEGKLIAHCWVESQTGWVIDPTASQLEKQSEEKNPILIARKKSVQENYLKIKEWACPRRHNFRGWRSAVSPFGLNPETGRHHLQHVQRVLREEI